MLMNIQFKTCVNSLLNDLAYGYFPSFRQFKLILLDKRYV